METTNAHKLREVRKAEKIHSKGIQPYVRAALTLIERETPQNKKETQEKMDLIDKKWRHYCAKYKKTHPNRWPNTEAFVYNLVTLRENHKKSLKKR